MPRFETLCRPVLGLVCCGLLWAAPTPSPTAQEASRLDEVLDTIVANERALAARLERYHPLVETYLQAVRPDTTLGSVPVKDNYFIARLELPRTDRNKGRSRPKKAKGKTLTLLDQRRSESYRPESFSMMLMLDRGTFDREHYDFDFIRAEFLGEIRSLVFDVTPKPGKVNRMGGGRFTGRIWVEDRDFNIVRFNGIYASALAVSLHFDSWRLHMASGEWLPAYVYTEEAERVDKRHTLLHKGQTRIWGYEVERPDVEDEFTKVLIDAPRTVDPSDRPGIISPLGSARAWENEAENNVLLRLERAGLVAPVGEVDEVLQTVIANLEITNALDIQPPVRCRVLLTTPLESFTIGHTIVLSRGLIDVLPDESSLALVLAHELGHVLSGHEVDTRYAFSNQILIGDRQAMKQFTFQRNSMEEQEATERAIELLESSPYKDDLGSAGLFLKSLAATAESVTALLAPHFGHRLEHERLLEVQQIANAAPELEPASLAQVAALPLGSRVKLDPWNASIELMKNNQAVMLSARDKMPFQVTPLLPYLARQESAASERLTRRMSPDPDTGAANNRSN